MLRSALYALLFGAAHGADWNYNRCDKSNGPSAWTGACKTGSANTPIDLCGAVAFTAPAPSISLSGYTTSRKVKVLNTGYAIQIDMTDTTATLQAGTLATIVGRATDGLSPTWVLGQMHLHYGRTGKLNEGSEHYLQGKAYPAEAHFVHYNQDIASSVSTAVATNRGDALLVVGVFLEIQSTNAEILTAMSAYVPYAKKTGTELQSTYALSDLFDGTGDWYSYAGGLTTPTCNEQVTWIVMKQPKGITADNLKRLKEATTSPSSSSAKFAVQGSDVQGKHGTYRPLTNRNGRTVYYTGGVTAACTTVTEPTWNCNAGVFVQPSILMTLLVLCFLSIQH